MIFQRSVIKASRGIGQFGKLMVRHPRESIALGDHRSFLGLLVLCLLVIAPLLLIVSSATLRMLHRSSYARVQVGVANQAWKTLYSPREDWAPQDFFDPTNPTLWTSKTNRGQPEHAARVEKTVGGTLWLGTRFSEQALARAYFTQSNLIYLGTISGRYRIFIDGEQILAGSPQLQTHPIAIPVSLARLQDGKPLYLAIEINHDFGAAHPDALGGEHGEGFVPSSTEDTFALREIWHRHSEPLLFSLAFFILGAVFFLGWLSDGKKQEYAFFAAYSFHQALTEVVKLDLVRSLGGFRAWDESLVALLVWEGSLGLLLGMSYARAKRSWVLPIAALTAAVSALPFVISVSPTTLVKLQAELLLWYVPLAYLRGAMACLIQWHVLNRQKGIGLFAHRKTSLLRIGMALALVAGLYFAEALTFTNEDQRLTYFRLLNFTVVLAFYGLTIVDLRDQQRRQNSGRDIAASESHRLAA